MGVPLSPDKNHGDACAMPPSRDAHSSLGLQWSDSNSGRHWGSIKHRYPVFAPGSWHTAPITLSVSGVTECLLYANGMPGDGGGGGRGGRPLIGSGSGLVPRKTKSQLEDCTFQPKSQAPREGEGAGDGIQSPMADDLINQVLVM